MTISKEDALTLTEEEVWCTRWNNEVLINAPLKSDKSFYAKFAVRCKNQNEAEELLKKFTNQKP